MEFELSPEITDDVIFSMEDQNGHYVFDSVEARCVLAKEVKSEKKIAGEYDDDHYYAIPLWDSVSGFRMMERFVAQLRNPIVREELRTALTSGHGVFRKFKNIVKEHQEIERLWYQFKEREMKNIVLDWYNTLRDFWGIERIGSEPDETDEIVLQDFSFVPAGPNEEKCIKMIESIRNELLEGLSSTELSGAIFDIWDSFGHYLDDAMYSVKAETEEGEVSGLVVSGAVPFDSLQCAHISFIAVYPEFRGMGIARELLTQIIQHWSKKGYRWLLFSCLVFPVSFLPVLHRIGFISRGQIMVLDLSKNLCH